MRARTLVLLAVLLLPAPLTAQIRIRLPRIGRAPAPAPLPPQAPMIAREMQYKRSRLSSESYTFYNYSQPDHHVASNGVAAASILGLGVRTDYRIKPAFMITSDMTTAQFGGPFIQYTFDFGGRYRPVRPLDSKIRPYFDLRTSWAWSFASFAQPSDPTVSVASPTIQPGFTAAHGIGILAGTGFETSLTRTLALTTGLTLARYRMSALTFGQQQYGTPWNYRATGVRFIFGLKYNAGRWVPVPIQ